MKLRGYIGAIFFTTGIILLILLSGCLDRIDNAPPTTTILHPENGSVLSGVVPIIVTASDDKNVKSIKLFIDGQEVQTADGAEIRYEWDTDPISDNRQHFIAAYATDKDDNIGPSAITTVTLFDLQADTLPQIVTIQHPLNNQIVTGVVNIAVGVDRQFNNPIDSVQVFIDGAKVVTDREFPFLYQWDVTGLVNGTQHTIFAISYDRFGFNISSGVTTVTANTQNITQSPPTASIENPVDRQTVQGLVTLVCRADNFVAGNVADSVVFFVDGFRIGSDTDVADNIFRKTWDSSNEPNGSSHTIFAVVYDQQQFNVSTNFITVTVSSGIDFDVTAPTVAIIFPDPNAQNIFSVSQLGGIKVVADAFDDTRVTRVEFYIDGVLQNTDTVPLYEYDWNFAGFATGVDHTIYVRAYDPSDNVGVAFMGVRLEP